MTRPMKCPLDGGLTATPGRRPEILIWADYAHTRWQLTASRIDGSRTRESGRVSALHRAAKAH
jgi:hypothetical protein